MNRRYPAWTSCLLIVILGTFGAAPGLAAQSEDPPVAERPAPPAADVQLDYEDCDGDGETELVLENAYLRVEITTGRRAREARRHGFFPLLGARRTPSSPKYRTRFVWAGWINNITYKPTGQRWFADDTEHHWQGIPEEFEQAIRIKQTGRERFDVIKIGIGRCEGTGICHHSRLRLIRAYPWSMTVRRTPDGGRKVLFRQECSEPEGWGYVLEKEFTLAADSSALVVRRTLKNTGKHPIHTSWYTHAFWAQAAEGPGYDASSWTTIPLLCGPGRAGLPIVDTTSCRLEWPVRHGIWGAIPADRIFQNWYASGNDATGDVFTSVLQGANLAWMRVWTYRNTYSCEPFITIDLPPGASKTWSMTRFAANGLHGVDAATPDALIEWTVVRDAPSPAGDGSGAVLRVRGVVPQPLAALTLEVAFPAWKAKNNAGVSRRPIARATPQRSFSVDIRPIPPLPFRAQFTLRHGNRVLLQVERMVRDVGRRAPTPSVNAAPAAATIFTQVPGRRAGAPGLTAGADWMRSRLESAGFRASVVDPRRTAHPDKVWMLSRLAVIVDLPRVSPWFAQWLEDFVKDGNGLLYCPPLDLGAFEFSRLLPARRVLGRVTIEQPRPRDGTREFLEAIPDTRFHLVKASEHPILRGLPLYPAVAQDIARVALLEQAPNAGVILRFQRGRKALPLPNSPALLTNTFGKGRVVLTAFPVDWGLPSYWILYGRLGEYHRQLYMNAALWAAGLFPKPPRTGGKQTARKTSP